MHTEMDKGYDIRKRDVRCVMLCSTMLTQINGLLAAASPSLLCHEGG